MRFYPWITIPIILYFHACFLTLLWAPRLDLAALELIQMSKVILLYFILVNQINDISDVKLIAWSLVLTVAFEGALANLQGIFGKSLALGFLGELQGSERDVEAGKMFRVGGTLGHPNRLAMYLELLLPLCLSMAFVAVRKRQRVFVYGVFGIALIALIISGSRGGWIGSVIGIVAFFYFLIRTRHLHFRQLVAPMVMASLMIALVVFAYSDVLQRRLQGEDFGSAQSRIPMFQIAVNMIEANPFGGVGINNYQVKMKNYMKTVHALKYKSIDRPVHNMYLLIAGETGFFGLFIFLLLVFFLIKTLINTANSFRIDSAILAVGLLSGLIAFLAHGMVDKHSPGGYALFYAFMALTAAMHRVSNQAPEEM